MDGEMPAADAERWRAHLSACALCARYDRVLRRGVGILRGEQHVKSDPEFMLHLRYRLAHEEERMAMGPVTASAATSVTVAAVLALAAWVPMMFMARAQESESAVKVAELGRTASEIAWHGGKALDEQDSHATFEGPSVFLHHTTEAVALIEQGYTPLILEPPTAPPSYSQVTLTSFSSR
jgi:hypothetical protein